MKWRKGGVAQAPRRQLGCGADAGAMATGQERYSPRSDVRMLPDTADSIFWGSETSAAAVTSASWADWVAVAMAGEGCRA